MAKKKFTELPEADALTGSEILAIVQGGVSKRTTVDDLPATAAGSSFLEWSFSANGGNYPTTGRTVYVSIDEDGAVLEYGTWFGSGLLNPSSASDFWTK